VARSPMAAAESGSAASAVLVAISNVFALGLDDSSDPNPTRAMAISSGNTWVPSDWTNSIATQATASGLGAARATSSGLASGPDDVRNPIGGRGRAIAGIGVCATENARAMVDAKIGDAPSRTSICWMKARRDDTEDRGQRRSAPTKRSEIASCATPPRPSPHERMHSSSGRASSASWEFRSPAAINKYFCLLLRHGARHTFESGDTKSLQMDILTRKCKIFWRRHSA
jgi:hypothetical protein